MRDIENICLRDQTEFLALINPLRAQVNPECVPRLTLKNFVLTGWMSIANMTIFLIKLNRANSEHLLAWLDSKGHNKSHDCGLTHSSGKPRSWPQALKGLRRVIPLILFHDIFLHDSHHPSFHKFQLQLYLVIDSDFNLGLDLDLITVNLLEFDEINS